MKLCVECKHHVLDYLGEPMAYAQCNRPGLPVRIDMVTGEQMHNFCSSERITAENHCGAGGQYFEPEEKL